MSLWCRRNGDIARHAGGMSWNSVGGCSDMRLLLKGAPLLLPGLGAGFCASAWGPELLCWFARKLTWRRRWIAFSWVGELCWCTCAVTQESGGGTRGWVGSSAVSSDPWGLCPVLLNSFWMGSALHSNECPTRILLPASLPGAQVSVPICWALDLSWRHLERYFRCEPFPMEPTTSTEVTEYVVLKERDFIFFHLCRKSFSPKCVFYLSSC